MTVSITFESTEDLERVFGGRAKEWTEAHMPRKAAHWPDGLRAELNKTIVCLRAFATRRDVSKDDKALLRLRADRLQAIVEGK
jgi:hypothetical protein